MKLFEKKDLVGLDIGASAVKVVQLKKIKKKQGKMYELINLAYRKLPPETIKEDEFTKPEIVAETIKKTFADNKIETKNVAVSISGRSVIVKRIKLPKMLPEELEESIQWEAEQFIPFDINDVTLDFQIMPSDDPLNDNMDVLLVAVKKDRITDIVNIIELSELVPVVVDIDSFALENQYEINYTPDPEKYEALIDIGAETMCINVLKQGASVFTRDASIGINQLHRTMQREMFLNFSQSETLLNGIEVEGRTKDEIIPYRDNFYEELLAEIQRSFDYFRATAEDGVVSGIFLSGGGSLLENFSDFLNERMGLPVQQMDPFKNIFINLKKFDREYISSVSPMMAVGIGLALRRVGDR
ncbi:MAG: type IV pilus assembly protein PilM [bacterium]